MSLTTCGASARIEPSPCDAKQSRSLCDSLSDAGADSSAPDGPARASRVVLAFALVLASLTGAFVASVLLRFLLILRLGPAFLELRLLGWIFDILVDVYTIVISTMQHALLRTAVADALILVIKAH